MVGRPSVYIAVESDGLNVSLVLNFHFSIYKILKSIAGATHPLPYTVSKEAGCYSKIKNFNQTVDGD